MRLIKELQWRELADLPGVGIVFEDQMCTEVHDMFKPDIRTQTQSIQEEIGIASLKDTTQLEDHVIGSGERRRENSPSDDFERVELDDHLADADSLVSL